LITYLYTEGQVGQKVTLTILRDGEERNVEVTLQARPQSNTSSSNQGVSTQEGNGNAWLGVSGVTLNSDLAQEMDLNQNQDGVLIELIEQGSPADDAGLHGSYKPATINGERILVGGDVIIKANGETIHNTQDIQAVLNQSKPGDNLDLTVLRNGQEQEISLTLGERGN
ncbi:MAG: PDZ domain-containing protein, partial [Candidatus Promineifilaceae bacterium]